MLSWVSNKTTIRVVDEGEIFIKATRFVNNQLCLVITMCDGTVGDLATKVNRLSRLDD